jgi:Zn-dependent protease
LRRQFTLVEIAGIPVRVDPTLLAGCLCVLLLVSRMIESAGGGQSEAVLIACLLLSPLIYCASILLHELGHALTLRRSGISVEWISLNGWGGLTRATRQPDTPASEFSVSAAGPACTLVLVAAGLVGWRELAGTSQILLRDLALILAVLNALTLPPALVPVWPADGGHMLRALAWKLTGNPHTATRFACYQSMAIIGLLLFDGALSLVHPVLPGGHAAGIAGLIIGLLLTPNLRGIFRTLRRLAPATEAVAA